MEPPGVAEGRPSAWRALCQRGEGPPTAGPPPSLRGRAIGTARPRRNRYRAPADGPGSDAVEPGLELGSARPRDLRTAAHPAQVGVHRRLRGAGLAGVRLHAGRASSRLSALTSTRTTACGGPVRLRRAAGGAQEVVHLVGVEKAGDPEELLLLGRSGSDTGAELAAVEQDAVEGGLALKRLEAELVVDEEVGRAPLGEGLRDEDVLLAPGAVEPLAEDVVALLLELAGEAQQQRHARQEDAGGLAALAGAHEPADGLGEEQRRGGRRGVDADHEARDVDALADHADGDHPPVVALAERRDLLAGLRVVRQHHGGLVAGDAVQQLGVRPGLGLVARDHEAAGVRHVLAHLGEAAVGGAQHLRDPLALRVERRAPGLLRDVLGLVGAEHRGDLVTCLGAPAHAAAVRQEHHRAHDVVAQRVAVAVGVVGGSCADAVAPRRRR